MPPAAQIASDLADDFRDFDIGADIEARHRTAQRSGFGRARGLRGDVLSARDALRRAVGGLAGLGVGTILAVATLSWSPFDSTPDTAGLFTTGNTLGAPGARLANILMQTLGWGAVLLAALVVFAGLKSLLRPRPLGTRVERARTASIYFGTLLTGTATLSALPIPQSWALATGLGGWIGDLIYLGPRDLLAGWGLPLAGALVAAALFTGFGLGVARLVGIAGRDVLAMWDAALLVWAYARVYSERLVAWLRKRFSRAYVEPIESVDSLGGILREIPDAPPLAPAAPIPAPSPAAMPAPAPVSSKPKPKPRKRKPETFHFPDGAGFVLPTVDLLKTPPPRTATADPAMLARMSGGLHRVLGDYKIDGEMGEVRPGPVVTLFEFEPAPGVKSQRIINLSGDIARNMEVESARIAVVPGRNAMGVELPNKRRQTVWMRTMLESAAFRDSGASLPLILGEDIGGTPFVADLTKMPHLLVAGTTGSGKSVGVNAMILSLMYKLPPEACKFIMIDPKMLELSVYDGSPHLLAPVVTEPKKAVVALKWTVREMEDRYRKMSELKVRNMAAYNDKLSELAASGETPTKTVMTGYSKETGEPEYETTELDLAPMPYIVVIIDEMADLMMVAGKEVEGSVQRLAQMARAAGIHVIMATQRPSTDVITGTIKANFPARICFRVGSKVDSRVILGDIGGEALLGNGDMLYLGTGRPRRLHGPFVSDSEVERVAAFVKAQGTPQYLDDILREDDPDDAPESTPDTSLSLFDQAVDIVARDRRATTSYLQRKLGIGYNKAATLIEDMEQQGMIGPSGPGGKREIFLPEPQGV